MKVQLKKVLVLVESVQRWQIKYFEISFIFRKQFYFAIFCLQIMGRGNPDSNLQSHYIYIHKAHREREREERELGKV
jgi:hypothetical protein